MKFYYPGNIKAFKTSDINFIKFLNSISTQDISNPKINKSYYSCIVNVSGKFICDFILYRKSEYEFLFLISSNLLSFFKERVDQFCALYGYEYLETEHYVYAFYPNNEFALDKGSVFFEDPRLNKLPYFLINNKLISDVVDFENYIEIFIKNKISHTSFFTPEKSFIPKYGILSYAAAKSKGCYTGQEIVMKYISNHKDSENSMIYARQVKNLNLNLTNFTINEKGDLVLESSKSAYGFVVYKSKNKSLLLFCNQKIIKNGLLLVDGKTYKCS